MTSNELIQTRFIIVILLLLTMWNVNFEKTSHCLQKLCSQRVWSNLSQLAKCGQLRHRFLKKKKKKKKKTRLNASINAEPPIPERVFPEGWSEVRMQKDHPKKSVNSLIYTYNLLIQSFTRLLPVHHPLGHQR